MITAELIRKITELDPNGSQQVILYDNTDDYIFGVASIEAWPQPAKGYPEAVAITLGDAATDIARVLVPITDELIEDYMGYCEAKREMDEEPFAFSQWRNIETDVRAAYLAEGNHKNGG